MNFKRLFMITVFALFTATVQAQALNDAINAYNEARELASEKDYDGAISLYQQAINIASDLGTEGQDILERAENAIPRIYFSRAVEAYNTFKTNPSIPTLDEAIKEFAEAEEVAGESGDEEIQSRAVGIMAQLYYQKGTLLFKREDFEGADKAFTKAIETNSNYAKAYYQKGLVMKKLTPENLEGIMNWFDRSITVANTINDNEVVRLANNAAHAELLYRGSKAIEGQNYNRAIELLELSLEYSPESADSYYRLAEASNKLNNRNDAIRYATNALSLEQGGNTDKAKIYFELGLAHQSKGAKGPACEAFENASYGSFKSPAEHKIEFELKCESTSPDE